MINSTLRILPIVLLTSFIISLSSSCDLIKKETPRQVYNQEMAKFRKNEAETLPFYGTLQSLSRTTLLLQLESNIIPKWKQNEQITNKIGQINGLPENLSASNEKYKQYVSMRLKSMELLRKSLTENTSAYTSEIEFIEEDIREFVKTLK